MSATDTREQYRLKLARIAMDEMYQFVAVLDDKGTLLEVNRAALEGAGLQLSDVEGKPFWECYWWAVSKEIQEELKKAIRRASQGEFVRYDVEIFGRAAGKETIIIDFSMIPVRDESGRVTFIVPEGRDITEKKAYEREIAQKNIELAALDRAKTAFFSNVSHEFRTPLTLMLGPTEDLLAGAHGALTPEQRAQLELLRRNELRLQRLVNALLEFSRIEAGRAHASYEPVDLASLTCDIASSFRSAVERAGLKFVIDCNPLAEAVYVDRNMWEQIVLNLVSNALKFTFEGEIGVALCGAEGSVELVVRDTGVGVATEELPRLFERFHRVEGMRARTHEGSGIGLALVQELVRLHGGTIDATSALGGGTSFTITIPTGSAHLPSERIGAARTLPPTNAGPSLFVEEALRWLPSGETHSEASDEATAGARILVADDNADMRDYLRRILSPNWTVETVSDGRAALDAANQRRPDLILTDIMMPALDGFALLREIRANEHLAAVPVIMLSARAGEESCVEGLGAGADDYLVKPFSARELIARVTTQLKLAKAQAEIAQQRSDVLMVLREAPMTVSLYAIPEERYAFVNQAHIERFGRDVTGLSMEEAHPELDESQKRGYREIRYQVFAGNEVVELSEQARTMPDGSIRYYNAAAKPWLDHAGKKRGILGISVDVTEEVRGRLRAEAAQERLKRSELELRKALTQRDEFLSIASHELRTPLTTLGLQAAGLLRSIQQAPRNDPPIERWIQKAEKLHHQTNRLEQLIEGMLDVFGSIQLHEEELDLSLLAQDVVGRLRRESTQAKALLSLYAEPVIGRWDRQRLDQVFTQLLANALKFGAERPVDVVVKPAGETARITVTDRGMGIALEDQERIFDRFERAAPRENYGGFGLGLWIVAELVRAMAGTVRVESKPGAGATFIVELPRRT